MANNEDLSRREFVALSLAGAIGAVCSATMLGTPAVAQGDLPAGKKPVPASDPAAKAMSYAPDGKKVDAKKFPNHKPDQICDGCQFYKAANAKWGDCQLIQAGVVSAKGWCASWVKKA